MAYSVLFYHRGGVTRRPEKLFFTRSCASLLKPILKEIVARILMNIITSKSAKCASKVNGCSRRCRLLFRHRKVSATIVQEILKNQN